MNQIIKLLDHIRGCVCLHVTQNQQDSSAEQKVLAQFGIVKEHFMQEVEPGLLTKGYVASCGKQYNLAQ